jgi:hypothetical protein
MKMTHKILLALCLFSPVVLAESYSVLSREVLNVFMASKEVLFKKQTLINSNDTRLDKSGLFGRSFLREVDRVYRKNYGKALPAADHPVKALLYQSILSVLEDNRALIMDRQLDYKGLIPATFSFQLSQRFSNSGYPVKIKFVGLKEHLVNEMNAPDVWEDAVLSGNDLTNLGSNDVIQEYTVENGRSVIRSFQPIYFSKDCLSCHGSLADNPKNQLQDKKYWTSINTAGFDMQGFQLGDLAGGVTLLVDVLAVQEAANFDLR